MTTETLTIADFLLARIAEDEEWAGTVYDREGSISPNLHHWDCCSLDDELPFPCDCGVTARVLADLEAKRRIVRRWVAASRQVESRIEAGLPYDAIFRDARNLYGPLRDLAEVYADHADYHNEWREEWT